MEKLVFATNNKHKLEEIRKLLDGIVDIVSLADINCFDEIEETADSLQGNALIKARYIYNKYGLYCFADDTGLEVDALGGRPGVYTARYAGEHCSTQDNINKMLYELKNVAPPRTARFCTVIALIDKEGEHTFVGEVWGEITTEQQAYSGFGYDPIFKPKGYDKTFAQMTMEDKNKISHRGQAINKLVTYLSK